MIFNKILMLGVASVLSIPLFAASSAGVFIVHNTLNFNIPVQEAADYTPLAFPMPEPPTIPAKSTIRFKLNPKMNPGNGVMFGGFGAKDEWAFNMTPHNFHFRLMSEDATYVYNTEGGNVEIWLCNRANFTICAPRSNTRGISTQP